MTGFGSARRRGPAPHGGRELRQGPARHRGPARRRWLAPAVALPALASILLGLLSNEPGAATGPPEAPRPDDRAGAGETLGRVLLEIGPEHATLGDFLLYLKQINPVIDFGALPAEERRRWLDEFVEKKLFALRAREAGLDRAPEVRARIDFFVDSVLAQELKDRLLLGIAVGGAEIETYYQAHLEEFKDPPRVLLQHLLYESAEKATRARDQLREGAAFDRLVAEKKTDPEVLLAERRWFTPALLIPALQEAAFRLAAGQTGEVIRTSYGYHVLRVEEREPARARGLPAVRSEIVEKVRQARAARRYHEVLEETRSRQEIRLHLDKIFAESN